MTGGPLSLHIYVGKVTLYTAAAAAAAAAVCVRVCVCVFTCACVCVHAYCYYCIRMGVHILRLVILFDLSGSLLFWPQPYYKFALK